jgi:hypothetical protein
MTRNITIKFILYHKEIYMKPLRLIVLLGVLIYVLAGFPVRAAESERSKTVTVIVDGKANCLSLDKARRMDAGPGTHFFNTFPGVLPTIGKNMPHGCAFVRGWDHSKQTIEYGALYFGTKKDKNSHIYPGTLIHMKTKATIKGVRYHVFFVDDNTADNTGNIKFKLDHGKTFYVDARRHVLDLKKAKKVELIQGVWKLSSENLGPVGGPVMRKGTRFAGPKSDAHYEVLLRAHFHAGGDQYGVVTPRGLFDPIKGVHVTLMVPAGGAAVYLFFVDDYIEDNSGEVEVSFHKR